MQASRAVVTPENTAQMRIVLARMAGAVERVARKLGDTPDVRILYHSLGWLEGEADMLARNAPLEHPPVFRTMEVSMKQASGRPRRAPGWWPPWAEGRSAYDR